jgi:DNA transformation protein
MPLKSMRVTAGFRAFVTDQLSSLPGVHSRSMFGGVGLYADEVFFGIVAADVLYFKVDETNRGDYDRAGMSAFRPYADRAMIMPYYQVPVAVIEDADQLVRWAKRAVTVAKSAKKTKARKTKAKSKR